jgi:hypothetical protein
MLDAGRAADRSSVLCSARDTKSGCAVGAIHCSRLSALVIHRGRQAALRNSRRLCPDTNRYGVPTTRPLAFSVRVTTLVISPQPQPHGMPLLIGTSSPIGKTLARRPCALRFFAPA